MKRFHMHVAVENLEESIRFYSVMFGAQPTVHQPDYAKWMLEDPRMNFAISQRGIKAGIDHVGFQLDTDEELKAMRASVAAAEVAIHDQTGASCCYAKSDKYWTTDPSGIAWETYHTLDSIPTYGADHAVKASPSASTTITAASTGDAACCAPAAAPVKVAIPKPSKVAQSCGMDCGSD